MDSPKAGPPTPIAVLGSGAGTTAAAIMDLADSRVNARVVLVISNNSTAGIMEEARSHGVPTMHLSRVSHRDPGALDAAIADALDAAGAELVVLAGYMRKLGPGVLQRYAGRIVNTHPALLPAYGGKGMYGDRVHAAVLADGATVTGASVHVVTDEYDDGPVLAQSSVPVEPDDDLASLRSRVQDAEKALLLSWLAQRCGEAGTRVEVPAGFRARSAT